MTYDSLKIDQLASVTTCFPSREESHRHRRGRRHRPPPPRAPFAELGADVALMDIEPKREVLEYNANFIADKYKVKTLAPHGKRRRPRLCRRFHG